ncbi:hypothetical protein PM082_000203 [Marasmius tenuissimus]|nr:hypothetical protein PM082_000203 [Marasmius tenuissimus]
MTTSFLTLLQPEAPKPQAKKKAGPVIIGLFLEHSSRHASVRICRDMGTARDSLILRFPAIYKNAPGHVKQAQVGINDMPKTGTANIYVVATHPDDQGHGCRG